MQDPRKIRFFFQVRKKTLEKLIHEKIASILKTQQNNLIKFGNPGLNISLQLLQMSHKEKEKNLEQKKNIYIIIISSSSSNDKKIIRVG